MCGKVYVTKREAGGRKSFYICGVVDVSVCGVDNYVNLKYGFMNEKHVFYGQRLLKCRSATLCVASNGNVSVSKLNKL